MKYVLTFVDEKINTSVLAITDTLADCQKKMIEAVVNEIHYQYEDDFETEDYKEFTPHESVGDFIEWEVIKDLSQYKIVLNVSGIDYDRKIDELTYEINVYSD